MHHVKGLYVASPPKESEVKSRNSYILKIGELIEIKAAL